MALHLMGFLVSFLVGIELTGNAQGLPKVTYLGWRAERLERGSW